MNSKMFAMVAALALVAGCTCPMSNCKPAAAAGPLTPKAAVREMGRGINLGNTLEPPTEGAWNNGPAREYYFDDFKAAGFTCVRIPVRWDEHTATNAPYTIDEQWLGRVRQVVDWGVARGFFVILNAHHEGWLTTNYDNPDTRERFDRIWTQIADRFKDEPDRLLFEILNEPHGMRPDQVDVMNTRILKVIRGANPTRLVLFTGNDWSQPERLVAAAVPSDPYIIGTFHYYLPGTFACDGKGTWGSQKDRADLRREFAPVSAWSRGHGVPVFLGEFATLGTCDPASRRTYYATVAGEAVKRGFAFAVWDNGGDCRMYDRETRSWSGLKDVVIHAPAKP